VTTILCLMIVLAVMKTSQRKLTLEGVSSKIWKYIGFPTKNGQYIERDKWKQNEIICGGCRKWFKYNGNTSNVRSHLSSVHPSDFAVMEKEENSTKRPRISTTIKSKNILVENQLPALFEAWQTFSNSHPKWKTLTNSVCYFIAKLFDTVNSPGFQHLVEPRHKPPDKRTIAKHYMVNLYKPRVQQQLNNVEWYRITTDMWTSRAKHAYCAVTVHFIVEFKLQSFLISVHEFPDSHTAENIVQKLRMHFLNGICELWQLRTTDNGANWL